MSHIPSECASQGLSCSREAAHVHRWFELEPMSIFHTINAWQEGDLIRMYTCYTPQVCSDMHMVRKALWRLSVCMLCTY